MIVPMKLLDVVLVMIMAAVLVAQVTYAEQPGEPPSIPSFVIPKIAKPPTIDGTIDPVEWQGAMAVGGVVVANGPAEMLGKLMPRPTTYYLAWDDGHLYLAARTWLAAGTKPRCGGREPGAAGVFDVGLELHFKPMGKNLPPGGTDSSYKFFLNVLGFEGDLARVSVGQLFKNWLPKFVVKTRLTADGSAPYGGRWWELEASSVPEDFELKGPHRAGDQWRMMLGFNHLPGFVQQRIPATTSYFDAGGYPLATLAEDTPAVQARMEDLPGLTDGTAAVLVQVYNASDRVADVSVMVRVFDKDGDLLKREQALAVQPGKSAEFRINEPLPRKPAEATVHLRATQGGRILLDYAAPFRTDVPDRLLVKPAEPGKQPEETFSVRATFNPVRSTVYVEVDVYDLADPDRIGSARYRILKDGEAKPLVEGAIDRAITYYFRKLIPMQPLEPGSYTVEAVPITKDGKALEPKKASFAQLDEAREFPEWWNTKLGNVERVIPPFTAIRRRPTRPTSQTAQTFAFWGREYALNALGLPVAVRSQGEAVLAAPARVVAVVGGKTQIIGLNTSPEFTEDKPWRVAFTGSAAGAGLKLSATGWLEQDGLVYVELTYGPSGGRPVTVDALRIEFPISGREADCLLCIGPGGNYSARSTIILPKDRQGTLWSTLDAGRIGSGMTVGSFYPLVWIGNERRGLLWWGDNDEGWVPDNDVPAHEVVRDGNQVIFRNNIIGKPFTLEGPRTIRLSYMASPFRPLVKGWRATIGSEDGTFSGGPDWDGIGYKARMDPKTGEKVDGWSWLSPPSRDPKEWSAIWAQYKEKSDQRLRRHLLYDPAEARRWMFSHTSIPLFGYGPRTPDAKVNNYFNAEWEGNTYNKTEQDYLLYICDRAFSEGGLRTIYWDIFFPTQFKSVQSGLAYELPDGRIQPGYAGWNARRFLMRMYGLMHDHGLTPGSQVSHATNAYLLIGAPWMDAILDGEYHIIGDDTPMDWVDGWPIDRMRVMSCGENWGTVISWMDLVKVTDKERNARIRRGLRDYVRLFDSWRGPSTGSLPDSLIEFGFTSEKLQYVPFWRNPYVTCADEDVLVTIWRLPDRAALAVFNYDGEATKDVTLNVDLNALNLVPRPWHEFIRVHQLVKGEGEAAASLDFDARTLTVPALRPHTGRIIGIRKY